VPLTSGITERVTNMQTEDSYIDIRRWKVSIDNFPTRAFIMQASV